MFKSIISFDEESGENLSANASLEFVLDIATLDGTRHAQWSKVISRSKSSLSHRKRFRARLDEFGGCDIKLTLTVKTPANDGDAWQTVDKRGVAGLWIAPSLVRPQSAREVAREVRWDWRSHGVRGVIAQAFKTTARDALPSYELWVAKNQLTDAEHERQRNKAAQLAYRPLISILTPVYNTDPAVLRQTLESVRAQTYPHWELCLVNDGARDSSAGEMLNEYAERDARIKVHHRSENGGIVAASNDAFHLANGEFIALLDHDDALELDALFHVARLLNNHPQADWIYTDEDKITLDGRRYDPFPKPDWSLDYLLSCMYTSHLTVYRRSLVAEVGAFRPGYDGSQDHDLALRIAERTKEIHHIPRILYHWRAVPESAASSAEVKPYAYEAARRAIEDYIKRNDISAERMDGLGLGLHRMRYRIAGAPLVSIIVSPANASGNANLWKSDALANCIASIVRHTTYENYEVLYLDDGRLRPDTVSLINTLGDKRIRHLPLQEISNRMAKSNFAVAESRGEHLLFLDGNTQVRNGEWLETMLGFSQQKAVGVVGAKLYSSAGRIWHAGIVFHRALPLHVFSGAPGNVLDIIVARNYSAVTAACMMTRREVFEQVGGFDESFPLNYNDVDYCLKVREKGYRIVFTPFAELTHHESMTRSGDVAPEELTRLREKWGAKIMRDPYFQDVEYKFGRF